MRALGRPVGPSLAAPVRRPYAVSFATPPTRQSVQRRRREVLYALGGLVGATLLVALVTRSMLAYFLVLVSAGLLGGYSYLLVRIRQDRAARLARLERAEKVRYLPATDVVSVGGLRRRASS